MSFRLSLKYSFRTRILLLFFTLLLLNLHILPYVGASTSPWTQTDWTGGPGQASWLDTTRFDSSAGVSSVTAGQLTLEPTANWYDNSWGYRQQITFDNSGQTENLIDFPVLVVLNPTRIDYSKTQDAGQDIRFTDSDGVTVLPHEIETWNESGSSYVWVKVPQIDSSSSSDSIYIYYGNSSVGDTQAVAEVWDEDFQFVYHMKENPGGPAPQIQDSTSNNRDGTTTGVMTSGQQIAGRVNGGINMDGADDSINSNYNTHHSAYTIEGWTRPDSFGENSVGRVIEKRQAGAEVFNLFINSSGGHKFKFARNFSTARGVWSSPTSTITFGNWYHVVISYDDNPANNPSIYINGVNQVLLEEESPSGTPTNNTDNYIIGNRGDTTRAFDGVMDEFRMSDTIRSADWIAATFDSQTDGFNTYGIEESVYSAGAGTLISSILDTEGETDWEGIDWNATVPANTSAEVRVRTSDSATMSGAMDFASCDAVIDESDISGNNCVSDGERYVQYHISLANTDGASSPTFDSIEIAFTTTPPELPEAPSASSLEPTGGTLTIDTTPSLTFTASDPNLLDEIEYRLQIDNDSDFSSPVVDYTSAHQPQGLVSFTVGQVAGTGTYTIGAANQTLLDDSYYWRVRPTDSGGLQGIYAAAGGGTIAFTIDTTAPSIPVNLFSVSQTMDTVTLQWDQSSDNTGVEGYKVYRNGTEEHTVSASNVVDTGLQVNTEYAYTVVSYDAAGNVSAQSGTLLVKTKAQETGESVLLPSMPKSSVVTPEALQPDLPTDERTEDENESEGKLPTPLEQPTKNNITPLVVLGGSLLLGGGAFLAFKLLFARLSTGA